MSIQLAIMVAVLAGVYWMPERQERPSSDTFSEESNLLHLKLMKVIAALWTEGDI
jgi:hypothetical protein